MGTQKSKIHSVNSNLTLFEKKSYFSICTNRTLIPGFKTTMKNHSKVKNSKVLFPLAQIVVLSLKIYSQALKILIALKFCGNKISRFRCRGQKVAKFKCHEKRILSLTARLKCRENHPFLNSYIKNASTS